MAHGLEIHYKHDWHIAKIAIWGIVIVFIGLGGWLGYRYFTQGELPLNVRVSALQADPTVDESDISDKQIAEYTVAANEPRYIAIPKLGMGNTRVISAGIDSTNQLASPKNINDTTWYNKSATPGLGYGTVLIDGHSNGVTKDGVFAQLKQLQAGDEIKLERGDGKLLTYKVVENESISLDELNKTGMKMMATSAQQGKEGLNLISSDGTWVPKIKQFDRRIILRAIIKN